VDYQENAGAEAMKAQYLKELMGDPGYTVAYFEKRDGSDYIGVGSPYIHDLLHVDVDAEPMKIKIALRETREDLEDNPPLARCYDVLQGLIESGEIRGIIDGNDNIEKPIAVFYVKDGEIIETQCAERGWPNTTIDGRLMHDNEYFPTAMEAAKYAYGTDHSREWEDRQFAERESLLLKDLREFRTWRDAELAARAKLKAFIDNNTKKSGEDQ
jgi:hypothetical protein